MKLLVCVYIEDVTGGSDGVGGAGVARSGVVAKVGVRRC